MRPALFQGINDTLGPQAAGGLGQQTPHHGPFALLKAKAVDSLGAQSVTSRVQFLRQRTQSPRLRTGLPCWAAGVLAGDDDTLRLRLHQSAGSKASSPGCPMTAIPSGWVAANSWNCWIIF